MPLLQVRHLRCAFTSEQKKKDEIAVDDISFDIYPKECLGIVGESGSGKSVTAMSLLRLLPQPAGKILQGEIQFKGKDILRMKARHLRRIRGGEIGIIFQDPMQALNPVQSIGTQLIESIRLHQKIGAKAAYQEAIQLLERVQIAAAEERMHNYPHQLSGGMRQRVLIAQALAGKPQLLIADEPTTALDVTVQQQILELIKAQKDCATLLITHDLGLVAQHCDRILVMYAGRIVEMASVEELFENPLHAYTQALLASMPYGQREKKSLLPTIPGHISALSELVEGCRFCQRRGEAVEELRERPPFVEVAPGHFVEKCPHCTP